jgi:hypothetical protein
MISIRPIFIASLAAALFALPCLAFDTSCPESITTDQQLSQPASGWEPFARDPWGTAGKPPVPTRSGFSHIEIYDGAPKELADLVPDNERDTWTFEKPGDRKRPLFMACVYDSTYVRLVRQLPPKVTQCTARKNGALHCEEAAA